MDYASFAVKGKVINIFKDEITIKVSNRKVICKGYQLKERCKVNDHVMVDGFLDNRNHYIIGLYVLTPTKDTFYDTW